MLCCKILKCPNYGLWKVHILVLGVPNNRLTCMQGQKHLHFLIMCIYFYLICSTTPQRFIFPARPTRNSSFPRFAHTNWWAKWQIFHVDVNMKWFGICFKNDSFQWLRVDSFFWETINIHGALCFKTLQDVFIHLELLHTAWKVIFKNP